MKKIRNVSVVTDLNVILYNRRSFSLLGATDEHSTYRLRPDHGLSADARIPKMRPTLPRGLQGQEIFLPRSIPLSGLCPADLQGKSPRYRVLLANDEKSALSHGHPQQRFPEQLGPCQRKARLADLRRLRSRPHRRGSNSLPRRGHWPGSPEHRLCLRLHNDRPVSVAFPLGLFSKEERRHQTPYPSRPAGIHPFFYPYYRRENARCANPRCSPPRARFFLHPGPWIFGLFPALYSSSRPGLLRHPSQIESSIAKTPLASRR